MKKLSEERKTFAMSIFASTDTLSAALANIHDRQIAVINSREAELQEHLGNKLDTTIQQLRKLVNLSCGEYAMP